MYAHILQHVPFEGPGNIEPWLLDKGYGISYIHLYKSDPLPGLEQTDFLVIMGGSMSVNDEKSFPWLVAEKQFIRKCIEEGKPVLGICLGSQLIASALNAKVYPNREKEIGWFPVSGLSTADPSLFRFPDSFTAFHWHGDTFDLPPGAVRLARSEACENQAFQVGNNVIGLQFHLEVTPASLDDMIKRSGAELIPAKYVASEKEITGVSPDYFETVNKMMEKILNYLNSQT